METTTSQNTALQYLAGTPAVETHLQKWNRSHLRPIYSGQNGYSPKVMECGRNPQDPEGAQADTGRMCKVHTPWPQGGWSPGPSCEVTMLIPPVKCFSVTLLLAVSFPVQTGFAHIYMVYTSKVFLLDPHAFIQHTDLCLQRVVSPIKVYPAAVGQLHHDN